MTFRQSNNGSSSNGTSYKLKLLGVLLTVGYLVFLISGQETSMFLNLISSCDTTSSNLKEASSFVTDSSTSSEVQAVDATVKEGTEPITKIILLGERHSGTNWITDHLEECFGKDIAVDVAYKRFKHWFQEEDLERVPKNSAVVIAMFRDPYDWIEAMRERPHHAHDHIGLDWRSFVTKPWTGVRGENDKRLIETGQARGDASNETLECMEHYSFKEIVPCSFDDSKKKNGYGNYKYELNHDGSEKPYSSIVDLRKEKILNHLTVRDFEGTRAFFPFRYEDLNKDGTGVLLEKLTEITGIEPKCDATKATGEVKHKTVPKEYMDWMNKYADWGVEGQIGYHQR